MRVFIQHENGLIDANAVIDITVLPTNGGQIVLKSAIDPIGNLAAEPGVKVKSVAEDLVLAMETAAHSAKIHGSNVIAYDRASGKWWISSLGKTATRPIES